MSGELWDDQTPASRPRGGAQGLRCVLQLDVSPTTWSAPICNGYSVTVRDEDIASANGSLSYHRVVSGELWDAQTPASRPHDGAQGLRYVLKLWTCTERLQPMLRGVVTSNLVVTTQGGVVTTLARGL